jgi:hypothetical protein
VAVQSPNRGWEIFLNFIPAKPQNLVGQGPALQFSVLSKYRNCNIQCPQPFSEPIDVIAEVIVIAIFGQQLLY